MAIRRLPDPPETVIPMPTGLTVYVAQQRGDQTLHGDPKAFQCFPSETHPRWRPMIDTLATE
jgi:hypothetical protein